MSDVQFEDGHQGNTFKSRSVLGAPQVPGMANFLLQKGVIKEESHAKFVLFFVIIICLGLAILIPLFLFPKTPEVDMEKVREQMMSNSR